MAEIVNDLNPNVQNPLEDPALRAALHKASIESDAVAFIECKPWMFEVPEHKDIRPKEHLRVDAQRGYERVLDGILDSIADRAAYDLQTQALFVPNFPVPPDFMWQLDRLAQDTALPVFVQIPSLDEARSTHKVRSFWPSAEGYWDAAEARIPLSPNTCVIDTTNQGSEARQNISHIAKSPHNCAGALLELAKSPPHTLWSQLHHIKWDDELTTVEATSAGARKFYEYDAAIDDARDALRGYAFGDPEEIESVPQAAARKILATINDEPARDNLMQELAATGYKTAELSAIPLGMYLEHDADFFATYLAHLEHVTAHELASSDDIPLMISALLRSKQPEASAFVAQHLATDYEPDDAYAAKVIAPLLDELPAYTDTLWLWSGTSQAGGALRTLQAALCRYLENALQKGDGAAQSRPADPTLQFPHHRAAEILFKFDDPSLKNVLARHMRNLFGEVGADVNDPTFVRHYLKYRAHFGSLDDINAHVRFGGRAAARSELRAS